jgi:hypothetical protein
LNETGPGRPSPAHCGHALARQELVAHRSQGVQLATIQDFVIYRGTDYDWRKCEARLNALRLIITQGWPGSVIELLDVVGPLTDP